MGQTVFAVLEQVVRPGAGLREIASLLHLFPKAWTAPSIGPEGGHEVGGALATAVGSVRPILAAPG